MKYRFVRRELEYLRDSLASEYNTNAAHWGDQNPDRKALATRISNLTELLKEI
jgi:hypothetical protein